MEVREEDLEGYVPYGGVDSVDLDGYTPSSYAQTMSNEGLERQQQEIVTRDYPKVGDMLEAGKKASALSRVANALNMPGLAKAADTVQSPDFKEAKFDSKEIKAALKSGLDTVESIGRLGGIPEGMTKGALDIAVAAPYAAGKAAGRTWDLVAKGGNILLPGQPFDTEHEKEFDELLKETAMGRLIKKGGEKAPVFSDLVADAPAMVPLSLLGGAIAKGGLILLGKVVTAEKSSNALVGLLSTKFAQYAPKLKDSWTKSVSFRALTNPQSIGEAAFEGSLKPYVAGWAGKFVENVAADVASSPVWFFKDRPGDENYKQKYGLIAAKENLIWNAVFSCGTPMAIAAKRVVGRIAESTQLTKEYRTVLNRFREQGIDMTTPIKHKQIDVLRDFRVYSSFVHEIMEPVINGTKKFEEALQGSPQVAQLGVATNILTSKIKKLFGWADDVDIHLDTEKVLRRAAASGLDDVDFSKHTTWEQLEDLFDVHIKDGNVSDTFTPLVIVKPQGLALVAEKGKELHGQAKTLKNWLDKGLVETDGVHWKATMSGESAGIKILDPTGKLEDLRIVKGNARRAAMPFSDAIATRIAVEKAILKDSAKASFITADEVISELNPEITGGISESLTDAIKVIGMGDTKPVGMRAFLQSIDRAMRYNPEGKVIINLGEKANIGSIHLEKKAADMMPSWHKAMTEKDSVAFNQFYRIYSVLRNKGYDALEIVLDETDNNWKVILDPYSQHNIKMLTEIFGENKTAQLVKDATKGKESIPIYMPAMDDVSKIATVEGGSKGAALLVEWKNLQEQLYAAFDHSKRIYDSGRVYRRYHTQVADESGENLWRFSVGENATGKLEEGFVYRSKQDAEKGLRQYNQAHGITITTNTESGIQSLKPITKHDKRLFSRETLRNAPTEGAPRGRWQGNLYDEGFEAGVEIYQGCLAEVRGAYRANLKAAYSQVLDSLDITNRAATTEYLDMMLGKPPKPFVSQQIDRAVDQVIDFAHNSLFRKPKDLNPDDLFKAAPVVLRNKGRNWFNQQAKNISLTMYSAGNLSAATVNMVSLIQNIPMAVNWYSQFPNETKEMWLLRTGLKTAGKEGAQIASDTAIGIGFLRKMTKPEYVDKLYKMAEDTGVMTNELKELKFALNPLEKANQKFKTALLEKLSEPVFKTEEWSRLAAFGVGFELATRRFGLEEKFAKQFAANFVDVAMGGYNLFKRPGISNSMAMKHLTMFTTYTGNMLTRMFDMWEGGAKKELFKSNLLATLLFGPKAAPGVKQWLAMHAIEDDVTLSVMGDMGLSGMSGLVLNGMLDYDAVDLTRGFQEPLALSAIMDWIGLIDDVIGDIQTSGELDMRYVMEAVAARAPGVIYRRGAQAILGNKYTMNHNQVTAEKESLKEDIIQRARLLAGFGNKQERMFGNWSRFKEGKDIARQEAMKQLRMSMKAWERGKGTPDELFEHIFRIYGGDPNQATAMFIEVLQEAKSSKKDRLLMEMLKSNKYDSISEYFLNWITKMEQDGVLTN